jgi:LCP family protein required for cell wall assembly
MDKTQEVVSVKKGSRIKTGAKVLFLIYHIIMCLVLTAAITLLLIPNVKVKLLSTPLGKYITKTTITEESFQNIYDEEFKEEEIVQNEDINTVTLDKYINIALFGLDSRDQELDGTNSDTIMIVSIDRDSKDVKLVSIYRDSYQKIYNGEKPYYNKINSAYARGGAEGAINTLNQNFDLDISDYVAVNFNGIATIIDLLGGIDVNITEEERVYINGYLTETRKITGLDADDIYETGYVHLDGLQATAYCRIRYTAVYLEDGTSYNNDFGRTTRQRIVLTQLIQKAKAAGIDEVLSLCDEIFQSENDIFKTSMEYEEVMDLLPVLLEFSLNSTSGYPFTYDADVTINEASCIVVGGHSYNVKKLHEYLFGDYEYTPSAMVSQIDSTLKSLTGVYTIYTDEDLAESQTEE